MSYVLRRVILEDRWRKQLDEIIDICKEARIEEVLLMEQSHQMLMVPYTIEKHKRMADIYCKMANELRENGIIYSINLATLVGHVDANVDENMVMPFQKFVGDDLSEAKACYCILDEKWQEYAAEVCSLYAKSKPDKMFIDDDFRSLNHTTLIGCFCPIHVKKTSEEFGVELTAKSLLDYIYIASNTGQEQIVREAWMKINFTGQLEAARKMREGKDRINPGTRLGLMNSGEGSHSVQGRDMDRLLREFSGENQRPLSRPLGGGYSDVIHEHVFDIHQGMALSINQLGKDVQIVSEVENWPHTRFSKSIGSTLLQMEMHALAGAHDFTLNIYDYLATPFSQEPGFCNMLTKNKDRLTVIQELRRGKKLKGVGLPWKKEMAAKITPRGRSGAKGIFPDRTIDSLLVQFGIPTQFEIAAGNVILGDTVNCYSDSEIISLLTGGLLIDGLAHEHLCSRGFTKYLGCSSKGHIRFAAVERLDNNEFSGLFAGNNLPTNWFRMEIEGRYNYHLELHNGARSVSTLLDLEMKEMTPGIVISENSLGGKVAVLAVPVDKWQWIYRSRAYQIARIVEWLMSDDMPVWIEDSPNVGPFYYEDEKTKEGLLGIVSGNIDTIEFKLKTSLKLEKLFKNDVDDFIIQPLSTRFFRTYR